MSGRSNMIEPAWLEQLSTTTPTGRRLAAPRFRRQAQRSHRGDRDEHAVDAAPRRSRWIKMPWEDREVLLEAA